jgi:UDP-2,3-diacylglucosamine pyrophosphatase LpxH
MGFRPVALAELPYIDDVHLGTYGCHAKELLRYLKSIKPGTLVLNGDIIDIWQFSKRYWPKSHMQVVKHIMGLITKGTRVYYITGNHDEMLRRFVGFRLSGFTISNKVLLELDGKKAWIFHGDVFDVTMKHSRWLVKLGSISYDTLILVNKAVNFISEKMGRGKISLSKKVKNSVKTAVKYINSFEDVCAGIAVDNGYDYVLCGHIHQPQMRVVAAKGGSTMYLNSGDWIENLTALEYHEGNWRIYNYQDDPIANKHQWDDDQDVHLNNKDLFKHMVDEFSKLKQA